jgi:RHS repeat-associated protein
VKLDFAYDYHGRRIQKIVSTNNGSVYIAQSTNKFLYDGWNVVAETGPNNALIRSYMWGADLSGSAQGAGGVGGLLEVSYYGSSTTNCFPAFDGNGNVAALVNAADGTAAANYEYGPFGEVIRATGPMAKANPFRWSTKYQDDESDLVMYPARPYSPSTGRFLSCDPIAELGGLNLYGFVQNNPVQGIDPLGLYNWGTPGEFLIQKELNSIDGKWYTRSSVKGNWFAKRPGDGTPCCEKPAQLQGRRTDTRGWISGINMSVELSFTGGPYKELILLWMTCYLPDLTAGVRMQCINSTTCSIPTTWGGQFFGSYLTTAEVSYLSCEGGKWTTKRAGFVRDY